MEMVPTGGVTWWGRGTRLSIDSCPALPDRGLEHLGSQRIAEFSETLYRLPGDWRTKRWGLECQARECGFYPADTGEPLKVLEQRCYVGFCFFPFVGSQILLTSNTCMLTPRKRAGRIHIGGCDANFWDGQGSRGRCPSSIQYPIWSEYFTIRIYLYNLKQDEK